MSTITPGKRRFDRQGATCSMGTMFIDDIPASYRFWPWPRETWKVLGVPVLRSNG